MKSFVRPDDVLLLKASRAARLERVAEPESLRLLRAEIMRRTERLTLSLVPQERKRGG